VLDARYAMLSRILGATFGQDRTNIFPSPPTSLTITEQIFWYIGWHVYRAQFVLTVVFSRTSESPYLLTLVHSHWETKQGFTPLILGTSANILCFKSIRALSSLESTCDEAKSACLSRCLPRCIKRPIIASCKTN
jgi:hypothetical protein